MLLSPLRYPGGKAKLYDYFTDIIATNNLYQSIYCEPYAGGAGLAVRLLVNGYVERAVLNDIDPTVYAFWRCVLDHTDAFCALVENTPVSIEEWFKQRLIWKTAANHDILTVGFATFFLNRTNRSGIIEGAGPIGGYKQDGNWKVDVRFNKKTLTENIVGISKMRSQISFLNTDATEFVPVFLQKANTLMYLDPPYYVKGSALYRNYYKHNDHCQIRDILSRYRSSKWVVSYDDNEYIREIYRDFQPTNYKLIYSAGNKTLGSEVMYFSDCISAPGRARVMKTA